MKRPPRLIFLLSVLSPSVRSQWTGPLPPWEVNPFYFGWNLQTRQPQVNQCSPIALIIEPRQDSTAPTGPPYTLYLYGGSYPPLTYDAGSGPTYNWTADLPVGSYLLEFKDGNGATSGTGPVFQINEARAAANCTIRSFPQNTLSFQRTERLAQCSTMRIRASGGTPPYTLQVVPATLPPKTIAFATADMEYAIDLAPGSGFSLIVRDSTGLIGAEGMLFATASSDTSCMNVAGSLPNTTLTTTYSLTPGQATYVPAANTPTASVAGTQSASSPNLGAIIGGTVGGVALLALLIFLFAFVRRRRRAKMETPESHVARPYTDYPSTPFISTEAQSPVMSSTHSHGYPSPSTRPSQFAVDPYSYMSSNTSSSGLTSKRPSEATTALLPGPHSIQHSTDSSTASQSAPGGAVASPAGGSSPAPVTEGLGLEHDEPLEPPPNYRESMMEKRSSRPRALVPA